MSHFNTTLTVVSLSHSCLRPKTHASATNLHCHRMCALDNTPVYLFIMSPSPITNTIRTASPLDITESCLFTDYSWTSQQTTSRQPTFLDQHSMAAPSLTQLRALNHLNPLALSLDCTSENRNRTCPAVHEHSLLQHAKSLS